MLFLLSHIIHLFLFLVGIWTLSVSAIVFLFLFFYGLTIEGVSFSMGVINCEFKQRLYDYDILLLSV